MDERKEIKILLTKEAYLGKKLRLGAKKEKSFMSSY
jgi:hypothetical protein